MTMKSKWLVIAFAFSLVSFLQGEGADLVLLTDAPEQSVSTHHVCLSLGSSLVEGLALGLAYKACLWQLNTIKFYLC